MAYENGRYAALDIGTVTCRMLVADVRDGALTDLDKEYRITDLGVGVDATGRLQPAAMERVMAAVDDYLAVLAQFDTVEHPVRRLIAMATSAARDASNAEEFTALLAERGVTLTVIPGQREAALTFAGASSDFPGENLLVVDIGGGSTEVVAGRAGAEPVASHSFNIGCRRVTERFFHSDPPTADQMAAARQWIREEMTAYFGDLAARGFAIERLVAVAGTATSVVSIREEMAVYDSSRVHKAVVTREQLRAITDRLAALPTAERERTVGLDPKRAGVIVAGFIILEEVLRLADAAAYTVSESDILNGMILEAARA
ncbi:Ppx/GppA phosphatase family protein [Adlercreutzia equolifaciens]|uniref:Ppx/GppA phosphatase family protein n=1 Tax=Adlercreutzia equolifaciens TaxID=446660 RepID=UPI0023AECE3B|nr:Ppx/GppA phosphatase family protein [Adlercreutzia equolifaciens]MDE8702064.1 Ppx/GppA phosphatase family protein [Adlercreutzia equolifaciens]